MDFGAVGLEGFVGSEATTGFTSHDSDPGHKWYGSGFFKQGRFCNNEDEPRSSKLPKNDEFSGSEPLMFQHQQRNTLFRSNASLTILLDAQEERQMLSFSAPKSDAPSVDRSSKNLTFTPQVRTRIRKSLVSADISSFSGGQLRPNTLGWGAFQLGFSNHTDPESGRCCRTDRKKWRCSRDAVAYQKYCEHHMNRGRNRSRKHVEGQSGHSIVAVATSTTKLMPNVLSSSALEVRPVGGLVVASPTASPMLGSKDLTSQKTESQHPLCRFIDDWLKSQSDCSAISWPKLDVRSYRTQLSISVPMAASDFTSSPNNKNLTPSPLRLSREFNPIHIGLGVGDVAYESNRRQVNWTPVSWETSMAGPLGEALHSTNSSTMGSYKRQPWVLFQIAVPEAVQEQRITKTRKVVTHCSDLLSSALVESSNLPAL
ncbi:hypothetical protein V6N12_070255 [Hibiscus sabdariffa]|uniref:Growth-regulating factor n=1 Tax=Hibiscus sabdariffa TaxID=183260 RepID=A0ABR2FG93_9ROSI